MPCSPRRSAAMPSIVLIRRPDLKVVGPEVPTSALKEYLEGCLPRCRRLGASIVVWGSAGSRNVPEGFSREQARDQIAGFLKMAGEVARRSHVIVAIEPLRHQESNILNTGAEALEMVRRVKHPNIRMIIDYFHLREENEDPRIIEIGKTRDSTPALRQSPWPRVAARSGGRRSLCRVLWVSEENRILGGNFDRGSRLFREGRQGQPGVLSAGFSLMGTETAPSAKRGSATRIPSQDTALTQSDVPKIGFCRLENSIRGPSGTLKSTRHR